MSNYLERIFHVTGKGTWTKDNDGDYIADFPVGMSAAILGTDSTFTLLELQLISGALYKEVQALRSNSGTLTNLGKRTIPNSTLTIQSYVDLTLREAPNTEPS